MKLQEEPEDGDSTEQQPGNGCSSKQPQFQSDSRNFILAGGIQTQRSPKLKMLTAEDLNLSPVWETEW